MAACQPTSALPLSGWAEHFTLGHLPISLGFNQLQKFLLGKFYSGSLNQKESKNSLSDVNSETNGSTQQWVEQSTHSTPRSLNGPWMPIKPLS